MLRNLPYRTLTAVLLGLPLMAGAGESAQLPSFGQADADGSGMISIEEAVAAGVPESEARREDIDGDGELSVADWKFVDLEPERGGGDDSDSE